MKDYKGALYYLMTEIWEYSPDKGKNTLTKQAHEDLTELVETTQNATTLSEAEEAISRIIDGHTYECGNPNLIIIDAMVAVKDIHIVRSFINSALTELDRLQKKEVPMKVIYDEKLKGYCPICDRTDMIPYDLYCPKCGQKLDWSDKQ